MATGRVDIVGSSTEPEYALEYLRAHQVDVLFLDVQMPELTGFDLIQQLETPPLVVFTTAYDRYALDVFEANSIDYLLKPVEPDRLQRALDKVERMAGASHRASSGSHLPGDLHALARELAAQLTPQRAPDRIASQSGERVVLLDLARVSHFVSRDKLTFAVMNGREHVVDRTLAELEATLDGRRFVRIHRATIVNIKQNLFFAFIYNILGIPLAAGVLYPLTGWLLSPVIASLAMALSSVSVVSNALRLRGFTVARS